MQWTGLSLFFFPFFITMFEQGGDALKFILRVSPTKLEIVIKSKTFHKHRVIPHCSLDNNYSILSITGGLTYKSRNTRNIVEGKHIQGRSIQRKYNSVVISLQ